jgi:hypothetical protein
LFIFYCCFVFCIVGTSSLSTCLVLMCVCLPYFGLCAFFINKRVVFRGYFVTACLGHID